MSTIPKLRNRSRRVANADGQPTYLPTRKVVVSFAATVAVTVLIAVLSAVTPEMLAWAGQYAPLIATAVTALVGVLTAYFVPNGATR